MERKGRVFTIAAAVGVILLLVGMIIATASAIFCDADYFVLGTSLMFLGCVPFLLVG